MITEQARVFMSNLWSYVYYMNWTLCLLHELDSVSKREVELNIHAGWGVWERDRDKKIILVRVHGARGTNKQTLLILVSQFSSVDREE